VLELAALEWSPQLQEADYFMRLVGAAADTTQLLLLVWVVHP
jgi:hypothetical protein